MTRDTLRLPAAVDTETGVFVEPLGTAIRAVRRQGTPGPDDALMVIGLGSMGLLMTQLGRVYGARTVIGSDFVAERRALAAGLGADTVVDPADDGADAAVRDATGGRGADVVIVCPGDEAAVAAGIRAAAPGGRVVLFTPFPPDRRLSIDQSAMYFREVTLLQSYSCGPDETREALRLLEAGEVEVKALVTHRAGLDGVGAALERAKGAEGVKTIVFP